MRVLAHLISHNKGRMAEQFEYGIRLSLRQLINAIEVIGGYAWICSVVCTFPREWSIQLSTKPCLCRGTVISLSKILNNRLKDFLGGTWYYKIDLENFELTNVNRSSFCSSVFIIPYHVYLNDIVLIILLKTSNVSVIDMNRTITQSLRWNHGLPYPYPDRLRSNLPIGLCIIYLAWQWPLSQFLKTPTSIFPRLCYALLALRVFTLRD